MGWCIACRGESAAAFAGLLMLVDSKKEEIKSVKNKVVKLSVWVPAALFACSSLLAVGLPLPHFDVASFKRLPFPPRGMTSEITPTSLTLRYATLGNCIELAYGFRHFRVLGPNWRERPSDVLYEIIGKTSSPVPVSQLKLMLQSLLEERLGLKAHQETREIRGYALRTTPNGPKLHRTDDAGDPSIKSIGPYASRYHGFSMAAFAQSLEETEVSRPVIDETGLSGAFDFNLDLSMYILDPSTGQPILDARGAVDSESSYLQALPKQLGLRLEPKTIPVQLLVIDRVQKDPSGN